MEFGLDSEQRLLDDAVRGFLRSHITLEEVRRIAGGSDGFDATLWQEVCNLGLPGLLVPERHGGSGLGLLEAAVAAEALGNASAPLPFVASNVMAPLAVRLLGSEEQQERCFPAIAEGRMRVAVGFAGGSLEVASSRLSGRVGEVLDAAGATHFLVFLQDGRAALAEADARGLQHRLRRTVDRTRALGDLAFGETPAELLASALEPASAMARTLDAGRIAIAADTVGAAQQMLDRAVEWARERRQFGRIVGSFQGVKHGLAEVVTMLEPCRALVWHAAYAQDALPEEARLLACHAKARAGDVGRETARVTTETFGAMGVTDLLGLHYWFKRCSFDRQVLGGPTRCREEAALAQGWGCADPG